MRRLLAAAVLVVTVLGAPIALWVFGRDLLPDRVPTWDDIQTFFTERDTGGLFLGAVVLIGVVAWLVFTGSVLLEVAALVAGRSRAWRIPGFGLPQRAAAALVTAVFTTTLVVSSAVPATAAPVPLAVAVQTLSTAADPAPTIGHNIPSAVAPVISSYEWSAPQTSGSNQQGQQQVVTWTVERYDTLWRIAEQSLGDGLRFNEIVDLNRGVTQADGRVLLNADTPLEVGWVLRLPSDASSPTAEVIPAGGGVVTVQSGDTLSQIALDHLDDATRYVEIAQLNNVADPDSVQVGQVLQLPLSPPEPTTTPAPTEDGRSATDLQPTAEPAEQPEPPAVSSNEAARADAGQIDADQPLTTEPAPPTPTAVAHPPTLTPELALAVGSPTPQHPTQSAVLEPVPVPASESVGELAPNPAVDSSAGRSVIFLAGGGGVLLAGLVLAVLARRRRRQQRHRRPGRAVPRPPAELVPLEQSMVAHAAPADVDWLDQALRGLVHATGDRLPELVAVRQSADLLELFLADVAEAVPPGWHVDEAGTVWSLRRGDDDGYDRSRRSSTYAPFPMLVSVGHSSDGARWLLDLEQSLSVVVTGDQERAENLVRFIAAELSHNVWSELLEVTLCGFGDQFVDLLSDRIRHADNVTGVVDQLTEQAGRVSGDEVLQIRGGDGSVEPWPPRVMVVSADAAGDRTAVTRLLETTSQRPGRSAVALVLSQGDNASTEQAGQVLRLDAEGTLTIPIRGGVTMVAEQLPTAEARDLCRLLRLAAEVDDAPAPPSAGVDPLDKVADATGGLTVSTGRPDLDRHPTVHLADANQQQWAGPSVLPQPTEVYVESAATTAEDVRRLAPQVPTVDAVAILASSSGLDQEVAEWFSANTVRPKVSLLGPVTVRAPGSLPADKPRVAWHTEVVALLACRPRGLTAGMFGAAMWPDEPGVEGKTKLRQAISVARQWLGKDPTTGRDFIPSSPGVASLYRIEGALVDADLFRRLRIRGAASGPDGIADLETALRLVVGPPFEHIRPGRYAWLAETPLHTEYTGMIVDVAHIVASHHLAEGNPESAIDAAKVALLAGCLDDTPRLDLVAACYKMGHDGEAAAWVQDLMRTHDADIPEALPRRTYAILLQTGWSQTAS